MANKSITPNSPTARSRVANGSQLLSGVDGRSVLYRRYRDLVSDLAVQAYGGEPTEAQLQLIRRAASISAWCEGQEALMASGADVDMLRYGTMANTLRRILADIGLEKRPEGPQTIDGWLANRSREATP